MIPILTQKTAEDTTKPNARALVVIDLGNGEVKAAIRMPGISGWICNKFDSTVKVFSQSEPDTIRLASAGGFKWYSVGRKGVLSECDRTGRSSEGKIINAKPLLIHAVSQIIKPRSGQAINVDVIFTSPSNAHYRQQIIDELSGNHSVMTFPNETDLDGEYVSFSINVHNAFGQLEGLRAVHNFEDGIEGNAYLIDIGHRTAIITKVNANAAVQDKERYLFDDRGVAFIADQIDRRDVLAAQMCFSPADVISTMFGSKQKKVISEAIKPVLVDVLGDLLEKMSDTNTKRFLIGGGAALPGISDLLKAKPAKDPQWANLYGLAAVADKVISFENRRAK